VYNINVLILINSLCGRRGTIWNRTTAVLSFYIEIEKAAFLTRDTLKFGVRFL